MCISMHKTAVSLFFQHYCFENSKASTNFGVLWNFYEMPWNFYGVLWSESEVRVEAVFEASLF